MSNLRSGTPGFFARIVAAFWTFSAFGLLIKGVIEGFYLTREWLFPWIALGFIIAVIIIGILATLGIQWAATILAVLAVCISLWAANLSIFFLWRGRYPFEFWCLVGAIMLGTVTVSLELWKWIKGKDES